jgi:hypothetical protein
MNNNNIYGKHAHLCHYSYPFDHKSYNFMSVITLSEGVLQIWVSSSSPQPIPLQQLKANQGTDYTLYVPNSYTLPIIVPTRLLI